MSSHLFDLVTRRAVLHEVDLRCDEYLQEFGREPDRGEVVGFAIESIEGHLPNIDLNVRFGVLKQAMGLERTLTDG